MRWVKSILRTLITAILLLLCAALFYILVIMGDSPKVEYEETPPPLSYAERWDRLA